MNNDFIPVLLGSDINAYGMAIQFYEEYKVTCIGIAKQVLPVCRNTKLIKYEILNKNIEDNKVFIDSLMMILKKYPAKKLLLVPCGDNYQELLVNNQEILKDNFYFSVPDKDVFNKLKTKEKFYKICKKYNLKFPKTIICNKDDWKKLKNQLDYPIVIKASNSPLYWNCNFSGKRKVFIVKDKKESSKIISAIYNSKYNDNLILQEFIPGDDSKMIVVNSYVGKDHKVKYISSGKVLLEECTPEGIGSYAALINEYNEKICNVVKQFLEEIKYQGFANFDIKYDEEKDEYNFLEINMRQGRSSFYVCAAGLNFVKCLCDDLIYKKEIGFIKVEKKVLYSIIPKNIIYRYVKDKNLKHETKQLVKDKLVFNSYYYHNDKSIKRFIRYKLNQLNFYYKYYKFFSKKGKYEE